MCLLVGHPWFWVRNRALVRGVCCAGRSGGGWYLSGGRWNFFVNAGVDCLGCLNYCKHVFILVVLCFGLEAEVGAKVFGRRLESGVGYSVGHDEILLFLLIFFFRLHGEVERLLEVIFCRTSSVLSMGAQRVCISISAHVCSIWLVTRDLWLFQVIEAVKAAHNYFRPGSSDAV